MAPYSQNRGMGVSHRVRIDDWGVHERTLSCGSVALIFALLLSGCGEPSTGTVLTPTEPDPVIEPEIEEQTDEVAEEDTVEEVVEPEPEVLPPMVWTAPASEDLRCGNLEIPFTFDGLSTEYSLNNAFWSMWFAKRSFTGDTAETEAELSALGFTDYRYIHNEIAQLQVLIVANDETMVIAYQGSKEFMDWIANFYFLQRDGEQGVSGRVHQGFALALDSEWNEILNTGSELFARRSDDLDQRAQYGSRTGNHHGSPAYSGRFQRRSSLYACIAESREYSLRARALQWTWWQSLPHGAWLGPDSASTTGRCIGGGCGQLHPARDYWFW